MALLDGARLVLAVTGGIAAYKAADLASRLVQSGALVDVVLTAGAERFLGSLTFSALTQRPIRGDLYAPWTTGDAGHVTLAADADLLLVAPATANAIARLALGFADDLLGAIALSTRAPIVVAPAMETNMLHHAAVQSHLQTLQDRGVTLIAPEAGRLASGASGEGRLATTETIIGTIRQVLGRDGSLAGRTLVVTAGGTHEPLDPVRFVGNRSSGRMGFALAQAAIDRGAAVVLVAGPVVLPPPVGVKLVRVETALEMAAAVDAGVERADALVMCAAVADYRPAVRSEQKIKKGDGETTPIVHLVRNPDIVGSVRKPGLVKIGFAAETESLLANARAKLAAKGLDLIVANDAVATIGAVQSQATIVHRDGTAELLPDMDKAHLAEVILDRLQGLLPGTAHQGGSQGG